jgi:hydrogenase large subunit
MCFTNLPIDFDDDGHAHLDHGGDFGVTTLAPKVTVPPPPPREHRTTELNIEPVTRVAGALAFHTTVDLDEGVVTEAHSEAVQFRGYELILLGRNPVEAIDISSRACGVCGGVHSTCAAMTLEMTFGVVPPPLAIVARNIAEAAELFYDHCLHLFLLAGPDYSEVMVRSTNPALWNRAERTPAAGKATHGLATVGEIMAGMNPLTGSLYREALAVTRSGREIVSLLFGKYPHPSTIVPAGIATVVDQDLLNKVLARVLELRDFAKKVAAIWEDIVNFFLDADPRYAEVGARTPNFLAMGIWDDPEAYDASYANADEWGARRLSTPGVVVDGELRTTRLNQVNTGVEEFVDHSFYGDWTDGLEPSTAPDGSPLSPYHPWNKRTIPRPEKRSWKDRYSWATAPRWDREPMEAGPLARQWITATAGLVQTDFIRSGGGELEVHVPGGSLPDTVVRWRVPGVSNALERNRARSTHVAYCLMVAYSCLLQGFDLVRDGETAMSTPFEVSDGIGVGYWEGGRGALTHHCKVEDGKLSGYQIVTPSTWMASPRDAWGTPGPYEEAVLNTPILEETGVGKDLMGIDVLRSIRSFDPCLPCAVHVHSGDATFVRDATTCACGQE